MSTRQSLLPPAAEAKHEEASRFFQQGHLADAVRLLGEILAEEESGELWNDWATAQFALGHVEEAEHGFRRALEIAPHDRQAAENLGYLLVQRQCFKEAVPFLQQVLSDGGEGERTAAASLLAECQQRLSAWFIEFVATLGAQLPPLGEIPRWPLNQLALYFVQQGNLGAALEMLWFNRHFQPANLELTKMQACIEMLSESAPGGNAFQQGPSGVTAV